MWPLAVLFSWKSNKVENDDSNYSMDTTTNKRNNSARRRNYKKKLSEKTMIKVGKVELHNSRFDQGIRTESPL